MIRHELKFGIFQTSTEKPNNALYLKQIHSSIIKHIDEHDSEGDGLIWKHHELKEKISMVYTADCLPIFIEGEYGSCLLHAGWRGIQKKIHLQEIITDISPKLCVIGPSIQKDSFEVTSEFTNYFPNSSNFSKNADKIYFDLQLEVKNDLKRKWKEIKIIDESICTFNSTKLHSYRRTGKTDRNYNFYKLY